MFIFDREKTQVGEGERERETENPKQAPHCQHKAQCGAQTRKLQDHGLKSDAQPTEPSKHLPTLTLFMTLCLIYQIANVRTPNVKINC